MPTLSLDEAQNHLKTTSVVTKKGEYLPLSSGPEQIGAVTSVGIQLYFTFLKYIGLAFCTWACFQLPLLIISIHGTANTDISGSLARTTVSNLGEANKIATKVDGIRPGDTWMLPGLGRVVILDMVPWFGILDAAGLLIFMVLMGWFFYRVLPSVVQTGDDNNVTPTHISIEISGLPARVEDHETYEAQLTKHIINICQRARADSYMPEDPHPELIVLENSLVRNYGGRLLKFQKLEKLQRKLTNAWLRDSSFEKQQEIEKIEEKMHKLRVDAVNIIGKAETRDVKDRAYVMLNSRKNKDVLLDYYRFANTRILRGLQTPHMRFHGHALKIVEAPQPSNIMWENQDRSEGKVVVKKCAFIFLSLVMLAASFAMCLHAKIHSKSLNDMMESCTSGADPLTARNWRRVLRERPIDACGCQQIGLAVIVANTILSQEICKDFVLQRIHFVANLCLDALVIMVVNTLLRVVMVWLTKLGRPLTRAKYDTTLALAIFVAQFLNTTIIILIAHAQGFPMVTGGYRDFDRAWYGTAGVAIILALLTTSFFPRCIAVASYPLQIAYRTFLSNNAATQPDLNDLYTWPTFPLARQVACLLNVMFSTMLYSAGIPLFSIIAMVTIFLVFWCDKFILLRASKKPLHYDQSTALIFKQLFPVACFLHATFAIFMFGHSLVFPSETDVVDSYRHTDHDGRSYIMTFIERCTSPTGLANFILWVVIAVFLVLKLMKLIFGAAFGNFIQAVGMTCTLQPCGLSTAKLHHTTRMSPTGKQRAKQKRDALLFTYAVEKHPTYGGWMQQADDTLFGTESRTSVHTLKREAILQTFGTTATTRNTHTARNSRVLKRRTPIVKDVSTDDDSAETVCETSIAS